MKDTALGEDLVTNIAPRAVYFTQTGGSALSNTYSAPVGHFIKVGTLLQNIISSSEV